MDDPKTDEGERITVRLAPGTIAELERRGRSWAQQRPATGGRYLTHNGDVKVSAVIREIIAARLQNGE